MSEKIPQPLDRLSDYESLRKFGEILAELEDSPAVKAAKMFDDGRREKERTGKIGAGVIITERAMDEILSHPDFKLYRAIQTILNHNEKKD